jgi:dolichol-phosphate mannosyltransferase
MTVRAATPKRPRVELSIVCSPGRYVGDLAAVHHAFVEQVASTGRSAEFVYVLAGHLPQVEEAMARIQSSPFPVRILRVPRGFDEAAALQYAFDESGGDRVITIPDRFQIDPATLPAVLAKLDEGVEVVLTRREPRRDALVNRFQSAAFHSIMRGVYDQPFKDLTCGMRGFTREAARGLDLYGDLHRFIPILAAKKGYRMAEVPGAQRSEDHRVRVFSPAVYARRLLDVLHVFFLTRFTSKPLRFFGIIGMTLGLVGFLITAALAYMRLFHGEALADRPMLLLGVLLLVVGVQIISTGLIGEIVLFFNSDRVKPEVDELDADAP